MHIFMQTWCSFWCCGVCNFLNMLFSLYLSLSLARSISLNHSDGPWNPFQIPHDAIITHRVTVLYT